MKIIILSDIHANLTAFKAVLMHAESTYGRVGLVNLGDTIDYGMRPNETIEVLDGLKRRILVNLAGNHERAALGMDCDRFSSGRGRRASEYTRSILSENSLDFISSEMHAGKVLVDFLGRRIVFVHGDFTDEFWGGMSDHEKSKGCYMEYDYVISGHSHIPCFREVFYEVENAAASRGRKKTTFINPGSVGQPRNCNPNAQYAVLDLDTGGVHFNAVSYDIQSEVCLYAGEVDHSYAERLIYGV